jgi:hypothetical protein
LALAKNRSLWSRIHTRLALGEATPGDTAEYIAHRLRRAGCERELFNSDATTLIHEQSQGRLRDTDRIATDALKLGARKKIKTIDRELVAAWSVTSRHSQTTERHQTADSRASHDDGHQEPALPRRALMAILLSGTACITSMMPITHAACLDCSYAARQHHVAERAFTCSWNACSRRRNRCSHARETRVHD